MKELLELQIYIQTLNIRAWDDVSYTDDDMSEVDEANIKSNLLDDINKKIEEIKQKSINQNNNGN